MNKISNISFGEIILSNRLKKAMEESQENPYELSHFKNAKPDCYVDLRCTKTGNYYLQATESIENGGIGNRITERLSLGRRQVPYVAHILAIYSKFQNSVEKYFSKNLK